MLQRRKIIRKPIKNKKYVNPIALIKCAWNETEKNFSPTRTFAYWKRSSLLKEWRNLEVSEANLKSSLNYPEYVIRDFRRWYLAQTDMAETVKVPWKDFDKWLKTNGYTGEVERSYWSRFVNPKENSNGTESLS